MKAGALIVTELESCVDDLVLTRLLFERSSSGGMGGEGWDGGQIMFFLCLVLRWLPPSRGAGCLVARFPFE